MSSKTQKSIEQRVNRAAEAALAKQHYVSALDIFLGMGLLQPVQIEDWRKGRTPYLERVVQGSLGKLSRTMKAFRQWALKRSLNPRETVYLARTRGPKRALRFSKSGHPNIEKAYRTHFVSPVLSEKKQQRLFNKLESSPDLVVFSVIRDSECSRCSQAIPRHNFLFMEENTALCLSCAKLNHLVYLPSGDRYLSLLSKKYSSVFAIVVQFSQARKRYERQGILVEKAALEKAEAENSSLK